LERVTHATVVIQKQVNRPKTTVVTYLRKAAITITLFKLSSDESIHVALRHGYLNACD